MLNGKTAVVTGGSRGIGRAICQCFAQNGASVAIIYNGNAEKASETKTMCEASGVKAEIYKCDVSDFSVCKETIDKIVADFGGIDILVNNAGITRDNLIITMEEEDFDTVINTNLKGCFNMIKACGRNFIRRKSGKIINLSSVSGINGLPGQANYSASKAGIIGLTKASAKELAGKNVCCNAIAPGFITTDMTASLNNEEFIKTIPLKRLGMPEDVAKLALFLASDLSDYITGEIIRVDGGLAI